MHIKPKGGGVVASPSLSLHPLLALQQSLYSNIKYSMAYFLRLLIPKMLVFVFVFVVFFLGHPTLGSSDFSGRDDSVQWAGYGEEKLSTVVIAGTILCNAGEPSLNPSINPHPVSGNQLHSIYISVHKS